MRFAGLMVFVALALVSTKALASDFTVRVGTDSMGSFVWTINGQLNPTLTLTRGQTYTFGVQAPGHPFDIKTAQVTGAGSQFTTGVTGEGIMNGTLTFVVPTDPSTPPLFYQCEVHGSMTGKIQLVAPMAAPSGGVWAAALLALCLAGGGASLRRWRPRG